MLPILGRATRSVVNLNRWLAINDCPTFAGLYAAAGHVYGVAWDMAIFQSILETNWFRFGGDVRPEQHNYAGIGASGGGAPGDSFANPAQGVTAQIQNLALRAGAHIPREKIVSPYVLRWYDLIASRNTKTWESLAGTWATDKHYTEKIFRIAAEFDKWQSENADPDVTWFQAYHVAPGETRIAAMDGNGNAKAVLSSKDKNVIVDFLQRYPKARNVEVASGDGAVTPTEEPTPEPRGGRLAGRRGLLAVGHWERAQGATGRAPDRPTEWTINKRQATVCATRLRAEGCHVDIYDPQDRDDLRREGRQAHGYDFFVCIHANAANADGNDEGGEVFTHPDATAECKRFAATVSAAMTAETGGRNRGAKTARYTVLVAAYEETDCYYNILTEGFFVDDYGNMKKALLRAEQAGLGIANGIVEFFGT